MLKNIVFPKGEEYRSGTNNEPFAFYLESLVESKRLDLLLGYFSSSAINVLALGFAKFISNGGRVRLIINHILSPQDKAAVLKGLATAEDDNQFSVEDFHGLRNALDKYGQHFFDCIAWLIAQKRIEIRAIRPVDRRGIAHYKSGIFYDGIDKVKFKGSCNFTASGLLENLEELDLKLSWKSDPDAFAEYEQDYDQIFDGQVDYAMLIPFEQIKEAIVQEHGGKDLDELLVNEHYLLAQKAKQKHTEATRRVMETIMQKIETYRSSPRFPFDSGPRQYQKDAYQNWVSNGYHGIFAMATGTGKTITALNCCLNQYTESKRYQIIILVPTTILVEQWEKEAKKFNFKKIIKASSRNPGWRDALHEIRNRQLVGVASSYVIISTYRTFTNDNFQAFLEQAGAEAILVADEAHNVGAPAIAAKFEKLPIQKLIGLSATPKRVYDEEGSGKMEAFFHDAPPYAYSFSMERAITEGILCQYYYYPHVVELTPNEMVVYTEISAKLASLHNRAAKDAMAQKSYEMLLMERKRIIHKATGKLVAFERILKDVAASPSGLKYMLVYAPEGYYEEDENAAESYPDVPDASRIIEYYANAVRQVSPTTHVAKYISESADKDHVLSSFEEGKIDVLLSMKCLDEGVDIPRTEQAIFCSSTGNPRQFIQRRGRILRQHPDKDFARIHDLVVVPSSMPTGATFDLERNLVKKELERVVDFAYMAINKYEAIAAVQSVCDRYDINPDTLDPYSSPTT
ncbi:DEAD/DEAH box helicase family protein [Hymenobacter sp. H14-R3]|uniref:DEAD/DEAH box helicase family protein n=1 Tax=Hymenobacter sp. H14-R3 TaxID=3046308 RepID=UPI0024BAAECB|nr:DEAD/DEAH box helicase family protein [Hymenobacter sp. H14-R3]MDJ0364839.1 DEAD/DEAH box helicase family protein [Hymenobacter sp. H14-R3]